MHIEVDVERCIGGGQCVLSAPALFDQDEDDGTVVLLAQPSAEQHDDARQAALVCPAAAITVQE